MRLLKSVSDGYAATTITNARLERARMILSNLTSVNGLTLLSETNTIVDAYGLPSTTGFFRRSTSVATNTPSANCAQLTVTTDVQKPEKADGIYYNARTLTGVFFLFDSN